MPYDRDRHHRRSIRLKNWDYASPGMYFVTICTERHVCIFGNIIDAEMHLSPWGEIVERCWLGISDHFSHVTLDAYVVMPNHLHGIIVIADRVTDPVEVRGPEDARRPVVGAQHAAPLPPSTTPPAPTPTHPPKSTSAPSRVVTPGSLSAIVRSFKAAVTREINHERGTPGTPIWQRNYWEHIIRNPKDYERIYTYILSNPGLWLEDSLYSE